MKNRIFGHPITSICGALVLIGGIVALIMGRINVEGFIGVITAAGFFFGLKDPKKPGKPPVGGVMALLILAFALSGCCSYKKCVENYGLQTSDSTRVVVEVEVPVEVTVPPDSLQLALLLDSLQRLAPGDTLNTVADSESGLLQLKISKGADHKINIRADYKSNSIQKTGKARATVTTAPPVIVQDKKPKGERKQGWGQRQWAHFKSFSAWIVIMELVLLIIFFAIKKLFR